MYCIDYVVYIDDDDQCLRCDNYARGVACPLLEALGQGVVYLEGSLTVTNCGFFKEFKRSLRVVRSEDA